MREPRNPFRMRLSEHIESDNSFLRMFSPDILDLLLDNFNNDIWSKVQIFRSAPGGGKTSLFRAFTPNSLLTLYEFRSDDDYKELYKKMNKLNVISDNGPNVLSIFLSCAPNYALLEDLSFKEIQKKRFLFALINSRLILATLNSAIVFRGLNYPDDLNQIKIVAPINSNLQAYISFPCTGKDLYKWACDIEKKVYFLTNSFDSELQYEIEGHDTLNSLLLLNPANILLNGEPISSKILVMFDDFHKMTATQRTNLLESMIDLRPATGIWIAERLEALSPKELLANGVTDGREYYKINLEDYWNNSKKFEKFATNVADRRVKIARNVQIGTFSAILHSSLDGKEMQDEFEKIIRTISDRVDKLVEDNKTYKKWIQITKSAEGTPRERAIAWRALEILIYRDQKKAQLSFDFELSEEDLLEREASSVKAAGDFFISEEFKKIPYYFGLSRLMALSSSNIEQFLAFAGELFEEAASFELINQKAILKPEQQEKILKRIALKRWKEIPYKIPNGRDVHKFLLAIRQFALEETMLPNAPYAPGVTGIAISMSDRDLIIKDSKYSYLVQLITSIVSNNLIEASLDRSQGVGKTWMILYLNRWLCIHFNLPIQFGGWRSTTPDTLIKWINEGFVSKRNRGDKLLKL